MLELLDLLSDEELPILKPEFYQGWQDRASRCHGLRRTMRQIIAGSIDAEQRPRLLALLAAYQRLVNVPAAVSLDTASLRREFPALLDLVELLRGEASAEDTTMAALNRCRQAVAAG